MSSPPKAAGARSTIQDFTPAHSYDNLAGPDLARRREPDSKFSARTGSYPDTDVVSIVDWEAGLDKGPWIDFVSYLANQYGSILSFFRILFLTHPYETILVSGLSALSTIFFYYYADGDKSKPHEFGYNLNWTLVSIALIFPLTMTITETFRRRETALQQLCTLKTSMTAIMMAHFDWDWYTIPSNEPRKPVYSGRNDAESKESARLRTHHAEDVKALLYRFIDVMYTVLTSPRISMARHYYTKSGITEREYIQTVQGKLDDCCVHFFHDLSKLGEKLKEAGLAVSEKSRLSAYEYSLYLSYLNLRAIKDYRTPSALRAYARMYIIITPLVFGPYYVLVANSTNLLFAVMLSIITTAAMQGLFNLRHTLEDPFAKPYFESDKHNRNIGDTIDLQYEFHDLKLDLQLIIDNKDTKYVDNFRVVEVEGRPRVLSMDTTLPLSQRSDRNLSFCRTAGVH